MSAGRALAPPDQAARRRAISTFDRPLLIEAGAGTGKTSTLVARVLAWALSRGWERATAELGVAAAGAEVAAATMGGIVAITFTEAAAAEMAARVGGGLAELVRSGRTSLLPDDLLELSGDDVRARSRALLVALDQMVVCTIHAYCRRLLALHPLEAGLHPAFAVDADGSARDEAARVAVTTWLRSAGDDADLATLARRGLTADQVIDAVRELLEAGMPTAALRRAPDASPAAAAALADLLAGAPRLAAVLARPAARTRRSDSLIRRIHEAVAAIAGALGQGATALAARQAVIGALDEKLAARLLQWARGTYGKEEAAAFGDCAGEVGEAALTVWRAWAALSPWDPELLDATRRVLAPLLDAARDALDRRGMVTFTGLLRRTRDLLRDRPEIADTVRREISQLLVDEFQDTDTVQCDIVRRLAATGPAAERPGLFLVADPKQSIYGWRGADLAAYDDFVSALGAEGLEVLNLDANFRSEPALLAEVERAVAPVMVENRGVQPPFRALLATVAEEPAGWRAPGRWASVEHWVSWPSPEGNPRSHEATALEARTLAADIAALHDAGLAWSAFGVLVRTSSDLDVYLEELRQRDIPYQVEKDRSYYQRREVIEAAALVRFVIDPCDQLAMVCWLRSAAVGVPDAALVPLWREALPALLSELRGPDPEREPRIASIAAAVAGALPAAVPGLGRVAGWELSLAAAARDLARLRATYRDGTAHGLVEELRARTLFEATEAARTAGPFRTANLARFFRRLEAALEESAADPGAVPRFLRIAVQEQREEAATRAGVSPAEAVTVTTIHGAKGLEFEHVYLMQAHKGSGGSRAGDAETGAAELASGWELRALGTQTPGWAAVEERRRTVADAELVRLLYVALTRAKRRLVVAGARAPTKGAARGATMAGLLEGRGPERADLGGLWQQAESQGRHWIDAHEARWVFPALLPDESAMPVAASASARADAVLPVPRADLVAARAAALERMSLPAVAAASAEAHRALADVGGGESRPGSGTHAHREVAAAVGSAVHALLEGLDFAADIGTELARLRPAAERVLGAHRFPAELQRAAGDQLGELLERLRWTPWPERFATLAGRVVARELPLLAPGPAPGQALAGYADLVVRDGAELLVIDYKTDTVEDGPALAERAAAYAGQATVYARAVAEGFGLAALPRCELWFLRAGRIVTV